MTITENAGEWSFPATLYMSLGGHVVPFDPCVSKAQRGPREKERALSKEYQSEESKETGSSFDSKLKLCDEPLSPPSRAAQAPGRACNVLSDRISLPVLQTKKLSCRRAELQAKSLGSQGGQGKFQPTLFCLQAQPSHYPTHSAKFKDVRA